MTDKLYSVIIRSLLSSPRLIEETYIDRVLTDTRVVATFDSMKDIVLYIDKMGIKVPLFRYYPTLHEFKAHTSKQSRSNGQPSEDYIKELAKRAIK